MANPATSAHARRADRVIAGSYFYAETSAYVGSTIQRIGNRGGIMLPGLVPSPFRSTALALLAVFSNKSFVLRLTGVNPP